MCALSRDAGLHANPYTRIGINIECRKAGRGSVQYPAAAATAAASGVKGTKEPERIIRLRVLDAARDEQTDLTDDLVIAGRLAGRSSVLLREPATMRPAQTDDSLSSMTLPAY